MAVLLTYIYVLTTKLPEEEKNPTDSTSTDTGLLTVIFTQRLHTRFNQNERNKVWSATSFVGTNSLNIEERKQRDKHL